MRLLILWKAFTIRTEPDVCMKPNTLSAPLPASAFVAPPGHAEEERDRHFERLGDPLQPAGADAVHAFLVLLHLLERDADPLGKLGLRQTAFQPPGAHSPPHFRVTIIGTPRADVLVDDLGLFHDRYLLLSCRLLHCGAADYARTPDFSCYFRAI